MLIESEHNMAREDKDGSATGFKSITMSPMLLGRDSLKGQELVG
jgi:hypothetical protein